MIVTRAGAVLISNSFHSVRVPIMLAIDQLGNWARCSAAARRPVEQRSECASARMRLCAFAPRGATPYDPGNAVEFC